MPLQVSSGSKPGLEVSLACRDLNLRMGFRMGWEMLGGGCGASRLFVTRSCLTPSDAWCKVQPHPVPWDCFPGVGIYAAVVLLFPVHVNCQWENPVRCWIAYLGFKVASPCPCRGIWGRGWILFVCLCFLLVLCFVFF